MPLPLIERSKEEIANTIKTKVESVEGVKGVSQLDVRVSGKRLDVNVLLSVATNLRWEESHKIALMAEREIKREYPQARVTVNTEPLLGAGESVWKLAKDTADRVARALSLAVAVGLVPELMPAIVTISLAQGANRMAKVKVIVKRLVSIEDFGNMDVLCTDKTGTLTEGKISLHALRSLGEKEDDRVLPYALLCNSAAVGETVVGNPMDRAIWEYAKKNAKEQSVASFTKIDEIPFDYQRRIMSVAVRNNSKTILISKGAPESIFARCTHADLSGRIEPLEEVQEAINDKFFHLSQLGYRLLAIGSRVIEDKKSYTIEDEKNLTLIGLLIFTDPAKKDAHEAIDRLKEMGVDVKILTGDNELVAKTICDELEIPVEKIIVGADLVQMSARV